MDSSLWFVLSLSALSVLLGGALAYLYYAMSSYLSRKSRDSKDEMILVCPRCNSSKYHFLTDPNYPRGMLRSCVDCGQIYTTKTAARLVVSSEDI